MYFYRIHKNWRTAAISLWIWEWDMLNNIIINWSFSMFCYPKPGNSQYPFVRSGWAKLKICMGNKWWIQWTSCMAKITRARLLPACIAKAIRIIWRNTGSNVTENDKQEISNSGQLIREISNDFMEKVSMMHKSFPNSYQLQPATNPPVPLTHQIASPQLI